MIPTKKYLRSKRISMRLQVKLKISLKAWFTTRIWIILSHFITRHSTITRMETRYSSLRCTLKSSLRTLNLFKTDFTAESPYLSKARIKRSRILLSRHLMSVLPLIHAIPSKETLMYSWRKTFYTSPIWSLWERFKRERTIICNNQLCSIINQDLTVLRKS
jgi:hypothetical protein